ncbi:uncharacterized protein LOC141531483 [Cotesia typhae]|uniref:uncharacterized protein LOC141531483 n=1 Tax=Cotesia typhae TaxID=2053667 RepID=UPI003D68F64D
MKSNFYQILCTTKVIEVRKSNNDNDIIDDPHIDDFLRMIAADGIWGNEGSIIPLCEALETKLFIFSVSGIAGILQVLMKMEPTTTKSSTKIMTIINMDNTHFYAYCMG